MPGAGGAGPVTAPALLGSVVIPAHNEATVILRCLDSFTEQVWLCEHQMDNVIGPAFIRRKAPRKRSLIRQAAGVPCRSKERIACHRKTERALAPLLLGGSRILILL